MQSNLLLWTPENRRTYVYSNADFTIPMNVCMQLKEIWNIIICTIDDLINDLINDLILDLCDVLSTFACTHNFP